MRKLSKPKFIKERDDFSETVNFTAEDYRRLALHIPSGFESEQKRKLLDITYLSVLFWKNRKFKNLVPIKEIDQKIKKLAELAKLLQRSIEGLQGDPYEHIHERIDYFHLKAFPASKFSEATKDQKDVKANFGTILENTWTNLEALRDASAYATSQLIIDRTVKPSVENARTLAYFMANNYRSIFGEYPPTDKISWFPAYMSELGSILNIDAKFGFSMLSSVILKMEEVDLER